MTVFLGDKRKFAVEVGDWDGAALCRVDLWVAGLIPAQFWREKHLLKHPEHAGKVFLVETRVSEFAGILDDLVAVLERDGDTSVVS